MRIAESRWQLRWIGYLLVAAVVALGVCGIVFSWPADKVGNGLQLLGLLIAALAIPILSPSLARVEVRAATAKAATARWIAAKRTALRGRWARLRKRPGAVRRRELGRTLVGIGRRIGEPHHRLWRRHSRPRNPGARADQVARRGIAQFQDGQSRRDATEARRATH
jgi:hypothetical protein